MRLLNTSTEFLEEFLTREIPKYAILSHTWEEEEVLFEHMRDQSHLTRRGWPKIKKTLEIALQAGFDYAWVDTCCIDKSSSAELSEAINSMYLWYQRSEVCYAFLSDLPVGASLGTALKHCRWFRRGWTLQELIAPTEVKFYDQGWEFIGSKVDLVKSLSEITGINSTILLHHQPLSSIAVAQKMSWAAHRETTRLEDTAYCLLGIFEVNMPLLYGDEGKAFRRLQEEIIKYTADMSIFAWRMPLTSRPTKHRERRYFCGVFAESPLSFAKSGSLVKSLDQQAPEVSITHTWVKTKARILLKDSRYVLSLEASQDTTPGRVLGIRLRMCGHDQYIREDPWNFVPSTNNLDRFPPRESYLHSASQVLDARKFTVQMRSHILQINFPQNIAIVEAGPLGRFDDEDHTFILSRDSKLDFSVMRLNVTHNLPGRGKPQVEARFMFYAVGWRALDVEPQCTLVDPQSSSTDQIWAQSEIGTWDPSSSKVADLLKYHKIPKSSAAAVEIQGTEDSILLSFTVTLETNLRMCPNKFWRIKFSSKFCKTTALPRIEHRTWATK